jgi:hypothetical protein
MYGVSIPEGVYTTALQRGHIFPGGASTRRSQRFRSGKYYSLGKVKLYFHRTYMRAYTVSTVLIFLRSIQLHQKEIEEERRNETNGITSHPTTANGHGKVAEISNSNP